MNWLKSLVDRPGANTRATLTDIMPGGRNQVIKKAYQLITSRLALSVGAQALVSGFHFALNLILLRLVTPYDYGIFAFAFVLAMFASAINNALISTPLTVYTPVIKDEEKRTQQETMFSTLNLLLSFTLLFLGGLYAWLTGISSEISVGVVAFVAIYSARHYSRSKGYARMRPLVTASGDITYVITGILVIGLLVLLQQELAIRDVLLALVAANASAMVVEQWQLYKTQFSFKFAVLAQYSLVWLQSRWALAGSLTTLFLAQAHSVIITTTHGPNAYAPLAAGFVLFGPIRVALLTWQNMVKPELAVALAEEKHHAVKQQIVKTTLITAAVVVAVSLFLWILWPWIHAFLYADKYADQPMALIVAIWAIITFFAASYNAPAAALQAMKAFKILALASIYGAILSGILVTILLYQFNPEATLVGILVAEVFMALFLTRVLYQRLATMQNHSVS